MPPRSLPLFALPLVALPACDTDSDSSTDTAAETDTAGDSAADTAGDSAADTGTDTGLGDCGDRVTNVEQVVCAAEAFLTTLTSSQAETVQYAWSDSVAKTLWSNLPPRMVPRAGVSFGDLSAASRAAALTVARAALSTQGYADYVGVLAADDYLAANGGGSDYGSGNYSIAFIGTPSVDGDWMLMLGGHHMAYNVTYLGGAEYPTPNHQAAEPKAAFTLNGESYAPMESEGSAFLALFASLSDRQRAAAYLQGQVFSDVLLGPDEYGTGSEAAVNFPSGADRGGVLASSLSEAQRALVVAVLQEWVGDLDDTAAAPLLAAYTTDAAWEDTYIAWAGDESKGPDLDVSGTYLRIDGPRVWVEMACQGGIVIRGQTHLHTIFRDKEQDYGGSL